MKTTFATAFLIHFLLLVLASDARRIKGVGKRYLQTTTSPGKGKGKGSKGKGSDCDTGKGKGKYSSTSSPGKGKGKYSSTSSPGKGKGMYSSTSSPGKGKGKGSTSVLCNQTVSVVQQVAPVEEVVFTPDPTVAPTAVPTAVPTPAPTAKPTVSNDMNFYGRNLKGEEEVSAHTDKRRGFRGSV